MTQCDEQNISQLFMNVEQKHAMRTEEARATETSVKSYVTTFCRNSKDQNQNSLFALWLELNSLPSQNFTCTNCIHKQILNTQWR